MILVKEWKHGQSVSFFAQHIAHPLLPPALTGDIRLFNVVCHKDGSIYTNYLGTTSEVETRGVVDGNVTHHKKDLPQQSEHRISIHGSGEVLDFNRGHGQMISHLGFALREIDKPVLILTHRIGGMTNYLADLLVTQSPKRTAVRVGEIFDQPLQPVFRLIAGPESYVPQGEDLVFRAITMPLCNGRRLSIAISMQYEPWSDERLRDHEILVNARPLNRIELALRWLRRGVKRLLTPVLPSFFRRNC